MLKKFAVLILAFMVIVQTILPTAVVVANEYNAEETPTTYEIEYNDEYDVEEADEDVILEVITDPVESDLEGGIEENTEETDLINDAEEAELVDETSEEVVAQEESQESGASVTTPLANDANNRMTPGEVDAYCAALTDFVVAGNTTGLPFPSSSITLPNVQLSDEARADWMANYLAMGTFEFELLTVQIVNDIREAYGLHPLQIDSTHMMAARFHAQTMATFAVPGNWSHDVGPYNGSANLGSVFGVPPSRRNAGAGNTTPESLIQMLMNSTGHCRNLLDPDIRYIGVGTHVGAGGVAGQVGGFGITTVFHYMFLTTTPSVPTTFPTPTEPPTEAPTVAPTEPPTEAPTLAPTEPPTEAPTVAPTEPSTVSPTEPPTVPPTTDPTEPPTAAPTVPPTVAPTVPPTAAPTVAPTLPTPTIPPTTDPTEPPTVAPTEEATTAPTEEATTAPTEEATTAPSEEETTAPSEEETTAPSEEETTAPTEAETTDPTEPPTVAPTEAETTAPTEAETTAPTEAETTAPSEEEATTPPTPNETWLAAVQANEAAVDILDVAFYELFDLLTNSTNLNPAYLENFSVLLGFFDELVEAAEDIIAAVADGDLSYEEATEQLSALTASILSLQTEVENFLTDDDEIPADLVELWDALAENEEVQIAVDIALVELFDILYEMQANGELTEADALAFALLVDEFFDLLEEIYYLVEYLLYNEEITIQEAIAIINANTASLIALLAEVEDFIDDVSEQPTQPPTTTTPPSTTPPTTTPPTTTQPPATTQPPTTAPSNNLPQTGADVANTAFAGIGLVGLGAIASIIKNKKN